MVTWSCPQVGCNKVYTSTSDVMTHENFHKKNTQLINDGFQRFRATEDCGTADCQFYGQKTTHFHCRWALWGAGTGLEAAPHVGQGLFHTTVWEGPVGCTNTVNRVGGYINIVGGACGLR